MKNLHAYLILGLGIPGHLAVQMNKIWSYSHPKLTYASIDILSEEILDTLRKEWTLSISESYEWHGDCEILWENVKTLNIDIKNENTILARLKILCFLDLLYWDFSAVTLDNSRIARMSLARDNLAVSTVYDQRVRPVCQVYNRPEAMHWFLNVLTLFLRQPTAI